MLSTSAVAVILAFCANRASSWVIGKEQTETHPKMTWQRCTGKGGSSCTNVNGEIVIDANWRWLHSVNGYTNCFDGNEWNTTACPDNAACTKNCAIEGSDYRGTYGITTSGNSLTLKFITKGQYSTNIGSRTYLMKDANNYEYIDGQANAEGWQASQSDPNAGIGKKGACCTEMDIWEANSISTALTPHSCQPEGYNVCTDDGCGGTYSLDRYAGTCDANGCDFNPYRVGVKDFYGKGKSGVDTSKKMTVVTQFLGSGQLTEIKRFYVQNGKVISNPEPTIPGMKGNSITQEWCNTQKEVFQEEIYPFNEFGGMASMGRGMNLGMVLVMSLWDDHYANMLWLDSNYPTDQDPEKPGIARGECDITSGVPADVESASPNAQVVFSNIKFGPIGSTFAQPA
ncbi:unnamed protein product [Alternaria alternata]